MHARRALGTLHPQLRLIDLFRSMDKDGSNSISKDELRRGLKVRSASTGALLLQPPLQQAKILNIDDDLFEALIKHLDTNGDGDIDYQACNGSRFNLLLMCGHDRSSCTAGIRSSRRVAGQANLPSRDLAAERPV